MAQDQTKKEALFNEVKGSLFEYLISKKIANLTGEELSFLQSLDPNYMMVLSQQDRMVRQFYPEMLVFLDDVSTLTVEKISEYFQEAPTSPKLMGKFINSSLASELNEADLLITTSGGVIPISLKLNKKNAFVNTKSGGIKSFFSQYFPYMGPSRQPAFNQLVDMEFSRMAAELHSIHEMDYTGNFQDWVKSGLSELPGELPPEDRLVLKAYYGRIAKEMHSILSEAQKSSREKFGESLAPLMGFGNQNILQVICFHEFKAKALPQIEIHPYKEIEKHLINAKIRPFNDTSSVEIQVGHWSLQIRVKPMNKFTTTAIKINCSVKVTPPSDA
jgi:hypothetical protein